MDACMNANVTQKGKMFEECASICEEQGIDGSMLAHPESVIFSFGHQHYTYQIYSDICSIATAEDLVDCGMKKMAALRLLKVPYYPDSKNDRQPTLCTKQC